MKVWAIRVLALIGAWSVGKFAFDSVRYYSDAKVYSANCEKVKPGMTVAEAKKVMGDYHYYTRANRSEIWTFLNDDTTKTYYLQYPTPFMASDGTQIHFDPITQLVTGVTCGGKSGK